MSKSFENIIAALIENGSASFTDVGDREIEWRVREGIIVCGEVQNVYNGIGKLHTVTLYNPDSFDVLRKCYEYCVNTDRCYIEYDENGRPLGNKSHSICGLTVSHK